jgi:hypothetical protein
MTEEQLRGFFAYLAEYINEELEREASIDKYSISDAYLSFMGGADND